MTAAAEPGSVPRFEARLAPVMFALAFVYLLVLAGLVHRAPRTDVTAAELDLMYEATAVLWPVFVIEAGVAVLRRAPGVSLRKAALRALLVVLVPPMRMGWVHPATDRIWLPRLGWRRPGRGLLRSLDRAFGGPMLLFAFLILPVLGLEYVHLVRAEASPTFALALDVSIALIWVAFALEFVLKVQAAPSSLGYMRDRWLDLAIVVLPTLEVVLTRWVDAAPLLRLLRLGRALGPEQLGAMSRAYRLQGLMTKGWHAFLLLEGVARLTGNTPEKRLRKLEEQIAELEGQAAELRAQADELRKRIAAKTHPLEARSEPEA
jgi:voltage-gated potassium channel